MVQNSGHQQKLSAAGLIVTLGIIYGDIGTSPLYVLNAITNGKVITEELIRGQEHILMPMIESTATIYDNNGVNEIYATAIVGVDLNQKGMQVPQQFGSASSYAKKYALGNLLLIDDTQDADATNNHGKEVKTTTEEDLKWLNKNTPEFNKAIEYLKNGGNIATIENKYKLAKAVKDELLKVK